MEDTDVLGNIQRLVDEERRLRDELSHDSQPATRERLKRIEVQLDQCWDLLRQRRGLRHAGVDPDEARPRDPGTVERYVQ